MKWPNMRQTSEASLVNVNIAHVVPHFGPEPDVIGGAGVMMRAIALESKRHGANVRVITDRYSPIAPRLNNWNRDGLDVYKFPLLQSMPNNVHPFGRTRRKYIISKISFRKVTRIICPDLAHFHMHPSGLLRLALEFKLRTQSRIVVTTHGLEHRYHDCGNYENLPYFPKWTESVEAVDAWVPCGPVDHRGLLTWGIPEEKIVPIYNGVDVPSSLPHNRRDEPNSQCRITYVGRMIGRKGIFDLAQAMAELAKQHKNRQFVLTMVGGCKAEVLRELQNSLQTPNGRLQGDFTGELPSDKIEHILYSTDIFCSPTKSPWEGLPLNILEAGAYGCPIILSDHPAHLAVYSPDVHAKYFQKANVKSLVEALTELVNSPDKRAFLRTNAYKLVKERFNINDMLQNYMSLYNRLL